MSPIGMFQQLRFDLDLETTRGFAKDRHTERGRRVSGSVACNLRSGIYYGVSALILQRY